MSATPQRVRQSSFADYVEVLHDRLYWGSTESMPEDTSDTHYFSVDKVLIYEPFFLDFGPLNLGMIYTYCKILHRKLAEPALQGKKIVHCCSTNPEQKAVAASLICSFQVIVMSKSAETAWEPFKDRENVNPFKPFRDASGLASSFDLTIFDCLKGLERSIKIGWFDWRRFNLESYEFYSRIEHGDMNWIIPGKFLAFAGPSANPIDSDGYPTFQPEDYAPMFQKAGINLVVRLNKKQYNRSRFVDAGIKHVDLYFQDGSCPSMAIISKFLHITELEPSAIAVHCKAGLGRTGTLIGLYAMKHNFFPARAFIAWNRMCRPGSILGPQQQFLVGMEHDMFQAGLAKCRIPAPISTTNGQQSLDAVPSLLKQIGKLSLQEHSKTENFEDYTDQGQGERLCKAKRTGTIPINNGHLMQARPAA